jgi:hypothetical protein
MIKQFILLLNFAGIFLVHLFTGNVTIDEKAPASVTAGTDFTVEVTINKGSTQDLPVSRMNCPQDLRLR